jgi:choline dehydrogenase-like flavoprotein
MSEKGRIAPLAETPDGADQNQPDNPHLGSPSRRRALSHLLGLVGATVATKWLPGGWHGRASAALAASPPGVMNPLDEMKGSFFSPAQKAAVSQVADLIIPSDDVAPGAGAAKVAEYLDFVVAHADKDEQRQWVQGLRLLDDLGTKRNGKAFTDLTPKQQVALLEGLARAEDDPRSPAEKFFVRLKGLVAEGYYTSEIGLMQDLKYKGNTPNPGSATCKDIFGTDLPAGLSESAPPPQAPMGEHPAPKSESLYSMSGVKFTYGRDLAAICKEEYDVCIVGSGAAGGIGAKELTEKGLRVVVLEAGNWVSPARFKTHVPPWKMPFRGRWINHHENDYSGFLYVKDPVTCPKEYIDYCLLPAVGGKTLTWAANAYRFGAKDFQNRGAGDDWPISYSELAPYYDRAELFMGVSGEMAGLAVLPDGRFMKPLPLRCGEEFIKAALKKVDAGYRITSVRKAINTEPHGGRPVCHYCAACDRGCDINALYTSANSAIPAAQRTGRLTLVTDAIVRELEVDGSGKRCSGAVFIDRRTRQEYRVRARAYALACGGVEDVRILLMSKSRDYPMGLANSSGWVGKNLISGQGVGGAVGYIERLLGTKVLNEDGVGEAGEIVNIYYDHPSTKFARGYKFDLVSGPVQIPSFMADVPGFGKNYREEVRRIYPAMVYFGTTGEMLANDKTYVDLDPEARDEFGLPKARMHLEWTENEFAMARDMREKSKALIEAAGGKVLGFRREGENLKPEFDGENLVGTARMGDDPRTSVLNRYNRSHDVRNLWVLDGASFTSISEKNPTLTVVAVAIRASDYLAEAMRKMET